MTELVAVVKSPSEPVSVYHDLEDGEVPCPAGSTDGVDFRTVPLATVRSDLDRCQHCSGEIQRAGGQGSTLAATLAAADPEEVSPP